MWVPSGELALGPRRRGVVSDWEDRFLRDEGVLAPGGLRWGRR